MTPFDLFLSRLQGVKHLKAPSAERRAVALCPAHDDHHPSLNIRELSDGRVIFVCSSHLCDSKAILDAIDLTFADLYPENLKFPAVGRLKEDGTRPSSKAVPMRNGITRNEMADSALHVFQCAVTLRMGEALSGNAMELLAEIVGRLDPGAIDRAAKRDRELAKKDEAGHE